jgi:hypothetical protein
MRFTHVALMTALISIGGTASAATLLNFEAGNPNYAPVDDAAVDANTFDFFNIRFSGQTTLAFEAVGNEGTEYKDAPKTPPVYPFSGAALTDVQGFVDDSIALPAGQTVQFDRPRGGGNGLGGFFLRALNGIGSGAPIATNFDATIFSIDYLRRPTSLITGQIWDIDGVNGQSEGWLVKAIGTDGVTVVGTQTSDVIGNNGQGSLDALPWTFSFDAAALPKISRIDFHFTGTKRTPIGVAFDNFQTGVAPIPVPAALPLLASAVGVLGWFGRRRRTA